MSDLGHGPKLKHRLLQMRGENLGRSVEFVEAAHAQIFDEACPIDAAQDLAVMAGLKGGPAAFHIAPPENIAAADNHAIRPDLDAAIDLDRRGDDEPIDDGHSNQASEIEPNALHRRMAKQEPGFNPGRCRPGEPTPESVAKAQIEILVDHEDAAFGGEEAAVIDIRVGLEAGPG